MLMKHAEAGDANLLKRINQVKTVAQSVTVLLLGVAIAGALLGFVGPLLGLH
jgi:hypothetical protein